MPYPLPEIPHDAWTALPDQGAMDRLLRAARAFWNVPDAAHIIAANGASALIARMPDLTMGEYVAIPEPTYNEHAAAFRSAGKYVNDPDITTPDVQVFVHPNNPDGVTYSRGAITQGHRDLTVIDESFCDVTPAQSHIALADTPRIVVLKSFGKFWGLAGLRLGFAIATPHSLARFGNSDAQASDMHAMLGPWSVSGPALQIAAQALEDTAWAEATRLRLAADAARLDGMVTATGATLVGGTSLFRLYDVADATAFQTRLAKHYIWSRVFPYNPRWLRLGLPPAEGWTRLEAALA